MSYNEGFTTDVLRELKLSPRTARLPVGGLLPHTVLTRLGFVVVYVQPLAEKTPNASGRLVRRFALRLMCECPKCDKNMAVGRLVQHLKFCKERGR